MENDGFVVRPIYGQFFGNMFVGRVCRLCLGFIGLARETYRYSSRNRELDWNNDGVAFKFGQKDSNRPESDN